MRWHVLKRQISNNWRKRWVRVTSAILVLGVAICVQYFVSRLPQAQDAETADARYRPARSRVKQQDLVIYGLFLPESEDVLLKFDGKDNETVEFRANKAKLASDAVEFLESFVQGQEAGPPVGFEKVDYLSENNQEALLNNALASKSEAKGQDASGTCTMLVAVSLIDKKLPAEIRFYQPDIGDPTFQTLEITASVDLEVQIHLGQPDSKKREGNPWALGCRKNLTIKDWNLTNNGLFDLKFTIAASEPFRFDFHTLRPTTSLESSSGLFEPFSMGEKPLKAKALSVGPHSADHGVLSGVGTPTLSVQAAGDLGLLNINNLKETREELQLDYSGVALIKSNGKDVKTLSLLDLINQFPILAAIFAVANAALAGWVLHAVFGRIKSP